MAGLSTESTDRVVWPASLKQLRFSEDFNQPIVGVAWPASLRKLESGPKFNQSIAGVDWPASLKQLTFEDKFNKPIVGVVPGVSTAATVRA